MLKSKFQPRTSTPIPICIVNAKGMPILRSACGPRAGLANAVSRSPSGSRPVAAQH